MPSFSGAKYNEVRDSQRSRVYKWDDTVTLPRAVDYREEKQYSWLKGEQPKVVMALATARELAHRVVQDFEVGAAPRIKDGRGTSIASASSWTVNLPRHARTLRTVLHELAHTLTERIYGRRGVAGHGAEYVLILAVLFVLYGGADEEECLHTLRLHRVRYAGMNDLVTHLIRRQNRRRANGKKYQRLSDIIAIVRFFQHNPCRLKPLKGQRRTR